jgi:glutamyl-tRNA synthetase
MTVRVRYAPSPTGHLHLGSLRTAFYNWLFARHFHGAFLVRIEDTDIERSKEIYTVSILESLKWVDIEPDEAIVIQSSRIEEHKKVAQKLVDEGKAYKCYCTQEELLKRLGEGAAQEDGYKRYDEKCRNQTSSAQNENLCYAIRFKIPHDREYVEFTDLIRGTIRFERDQLDDFIIVRSDGTPMYNFVVVVDDAFMKITHVLRGEDHISNTPKQILLYESCGYTLPSFAHFSMILGPDGQRLSKRHGDTALLEFKKRGFLADALCNYLVRLGWSHGDQEIFTRDELITYFSLDHMSKKGAIFDEKKLEWVNSIYIKALSADELITLIERDVTPGFSTSFSNWSTETLKSGIDLYKERVKTLKELVDDLHDLHKRLQSFTLDAALVDATTVTYLTAVQEGLTRSTDHAPQALDNLIKEICKHFGVAMPQIALPLRIALTGKKSSPGVGQLIALLSVEESITRIEYFIEFIKRSMKQNQ